MKDTVWKIGEAAAKEYLENNGYQIIEQNYQTKYSEIDLIVKKLVPPGGDNVLIFVEVRTKRSSTFVSPEESINQKKLKKLY
ncbi:YraN family protein, partial [Patescibacteria group bacterium]|nr:YraN family protein [Patescibacteria group bacterium]